jgi:hypothetical protein
VILKSIKEEKRKILLKEKYFNKIQKRRIRIGKKIYEIKYIRIIEFNEC